MASKRRVDPQRRAIRWSDADIDKLSEITPQDIEESRAWWRRNADPQYRELLDPDDADADSPPTP